MWPRVRCASGKEFYIAKPEDDRRRRDRHSRELEKNQQELRTSIAESQRLVDEADAMIRRHRDECEAEEKGKK